MVTNGIMVEYLGSVYVHEVVVRLLVIFGIVIVLLLYEPCMGFTKWICDKFFK